MLSIFRPFNTFVYGETIRVPPLVNAAIVVGCGEPPKM